MSFLFWVAYVTCSAAMFLYLSVAFAMRGMGELKSPATSISRNIIPILFGSVFWWWAILSWLWNKIVKRR